MKNFFTTIVLTLATLTVGKAAYAGFLIEPFVGYQMGSYKQPGGDGKTSGTDFGARLGGTTMGFIYGVEYSKSSVTADPDAAGSSNFDADTTNLGAFVGFNFPVLIRVYGTYIFKATNNISISGFDKDYTGTGTRIGVGYTGLPFVSINVEMLSTTLTKYDGSAIPGGDIKYSGTMLSVSLPLP